MIRRFLHWLRGLLIPSREITWEEALERIRVIQRGQKPPRRTQ